MKKHYTVYKITNQINKMIYVGVHITTNINDKYMGSGTNIKRIVRKYGKENFTKDVLFVYDNKNDMLAKELEIVNKDFIAREDTYNIILGGGYLTTNCAVVKDKNGNTFMINVNDPRYLNGELNSVSKGMITAKDKNGKLYHVNKSDPRWISGELVGQSKGLIHTKDAYGKIHRVYKNDTRISSGVLIPYAKIRNKPLYKRDKIRMMDINGKFYNVNKNDPRILSGELFKKQLGYMRVKDKNDNKFYLPKDDPRIIKSELILTYKKWKNIQPKPPKKPRHGSNNSIGGKIGLTNKELKKRKYVSNEELELYLSQGWTKGWQ